MLRQPRGLVKRIAERPRSAR